MILWWAVPFALSLWMYWPALHGTTLWDDNDALFANPMITSPLSPLSRIWFSHSAPDYWPLHYSFFWLGWRLWGGWTFPYHLINVLLHAANTLLVAAILRRLGARASYLCALLFCVHPVNAEAVAWIVQFKTLASTTLGAAAWLAFLAYLQVEEGRARKSALYLLAAALFTAGMLVKSAVVFAPLVFAACAFARYRDKKKTLLVTLPFIALACACGAAAATWYAPNQALPPHDALELGPLPVRIARAAWNLCFYLQKALWPDNLTFIYPKTELTGLVAYLPLLVLALAGVALVYLWQRRRLLWPLAAFAYYGLALGPVLGIFGIYFMRYAYVADHWQYLALSAVLFAAVQGLTSIPFVNGHKALGMAVGALVVVAGALATRVQAAKYQTEETLWSDTAARSPDAWVARNNYGKALMARQAYPEAAAELRAALRLKPDFRDAYNNLGALYLEQGQLEPAAAALRQALELWPDYPVAESNLGVALTQQGNLPAAADHLRRATQLAPEDASYHKNLGFTLQRLHQLDAAAAEYRTAIALSPRPDYWSDLGQILREANQLDAAEAALRHALELDPKHGLAMANLGFIDLARGDRQKALVWLRQAAAATPDSASIRLALASVLLQVGALPEARQQLQVARAIAPNTPGTSEVAAQLERASQGTE